MSDAGLNIVIGADVKSAVDGLKQVTDQVSQTVSAAKQIPSTAIPAAAAVDKIGDTAKESAVSIGVLRATLKDLKAQLESATGGANIESLKIQVKGVSDAIKQATTITGPAKEGFEKFRIGLEDIGRVVEGKTGGIRGIAQNFALLGPEITIAVAGLGFLGVELLKFANEGDAAERAQEKLNKSLAESGASAQGEITRIKDLSDIITNETNSRELRVGAFKKLQDEYPNALKNMSLEKSSLADIQGALNKVTDALLRQAQIKGLESAIADLYKKQAELINQSTTEILENASAWDKVKAVVSGLGAPATVASGLFVGHAEDIANTTVGINTINAKLKELLKTTISFGDDGVLGKGGKGSAKVQDDTLRFLEETKKNLEAAAGITSPIAKKFQQSMDGALGQINADILKAKIAKAIEDGTKNGVSPENIKRLTDSMLAAFDKVANANLLVPVTVSVVNRTEDPSKALEKQFSKLDKGAAIHLTIAGFNQDDVQKALDDATKLAADINKILASGIRNAIIDFGESLGSSIAKGVSPLKAAGDSILQAVGDLIESIGKALIQYGIIKTGLDTILKGGIAIPGVAALALGAAAVAVGALVKNIGHAHAFADGGIVTGPTLGLVGERGPEVIFPLSKLQQFIKGNTQGASTYIPDITLKGQDMVIAFARATKNNRLV